MKAKQTKPSTTIEKITPKLAEAYLATNIGHQRNVTMSHQFHLRQQMEKGQWIMTGEPIIFDNQGRLVDGQHRLRALIDANMEIEFVVIRGVLPESFMAMNRGKSRTSANVFAIHGTKNHTALASCVAGVLNYRRALAMEIKMKDGRTRQGGSLRTWVRASTTDLISEYDNHPDEYNAAVHIAANVKASCAVSISSTAAALALIDANHTLDEVADFWESVKKGAGLEEGDPILTLRNKLAANNSSKSKLGHHLILMIVIKAWNAHIMGKRLTLLKSFDGEGVKPVL
jgi:hypothetical protein